jgi:hypothetical protein
MSELDRWDSFYVIVGSAAGALIGLQFVVMTLMTQRPPLRVGQAGAAFSTPNIVHFSVVLLVSALFRAPWGTFEIPAVIFGLVGLAGVTYVFITARRMHLQTFYSPDLEDWLFHVLLPLGAYAGLAILAYAAFGDMRDALFGIGAAALVLLFSAIHNAWDAVAYHFFVSRPQRGPDEHQ